MDYKTGRPNHIEDALVKIHTQQWFTWTDIKIKLDELQTEYDNQEYARKRKEEYPTIEELVVALYDSEDRAAIDEKRAAVKLKHPKGG